MSTLTKLIPAIALTVVFFTGQPYELAGERVTMIYFPPPVIWWDGDTSFLLIEPLDAPGEAPEDDGEADKNACHDNCD